MHVLAQQFLTCLAALAVFCNSVACICSGVTQAGAAALRETAASAHHDHVGCHGHDHEGPGDRDSHEGNEPKCEHCQGAFAKATDGAAKPNLTPQPIHFAPPVVDVGPVVPGGSRSLTQYAANDLPAAPDNSLLRQHCALNT